MFVAFSARARPAICGLALPWHYWLGMTMLLISLGVIGVMVVVYTTAVAGPRYRPKSGRAEPPGEPFTERRSLGQPLEEGLTLKRDNLLITALLAAILLALGTVLLTQTDVTSTWLTDNKDAIGAVSDFATVIGFGVSALALALAARQLRLTGATNRATAMYQALKDCRAEVVKLIPELESDDVTKKRSAILQAINIYASLHILYESKIIAERDWQKALDDLTGLARRFHEFEECWAGSKGRYSEAFARAVDTKLAATTAGGG